ncbi:ABC-three component system protein [Acinetobacter baumannii]|uniref:ABC-three component system protein n=1 Tax=Acinetobacter calcoaceticus/baumannii complex TaxID=909768 RepID=UPI000461EBAC|nr:MULTISPECIES: ABC-three component system protein [Acinetobacter calcoaceticus/baumannii complex]KCY49750.1 hypothetical protein J715_1602 [Acinetobacter baumannii 1571545]EIB7122029.1 hypothetical protein [Acinetobacter baumannii]MCT9284049.1 hypothetical protein [Acinetobacter baumannii]MDA5696502.1 hypothetical protein [Acinetobacter baumannii]ODL93938.1 hypothetical protein AXH23_09535 [Acinetobacter pittii]
MSNNSLPHSAISSWGGFLYQGKVALFHSLKLIVDGNFDGKVIDTFELQLDSTDDFAIYYKGMAISTHQVKAKKSKNRSSYIEALEQASNVQKDCNIDTKRFFHVANELDDFSDYTNSQENIVAFYKYDDQCFCELSEIDNLLSNLLRDYLKLKSLDCTEKIILEKLVLLSELISEKILSNHAKIHSGETQNKVAYFNRINKDVIVGVLNQPQLFLMDKEYVALKFKQNLCNVIENYLYMYSEDYEDYEIHILTCILKFICENKSLDHITINDSIQPHTENYILDDDHVYDYLDVFLEFGIPPLLKDIPHYSCNLLNKYLPTALKVKASKRIRADAFVAKLKRNISNNPNLSNLIFEYNNLIAAEIDGDLQILDLNNIVNVVGDGGNLNNIVKPYSLRVISVSVAESEINAK